MRHFLSPLVPLLLVAMFALAGWIGGPAWRPDVAIVRALMEIRASSPALTGMMIATTWLGSAYATLGLAALVSIFLALRRAHGRAILLVAAVAAERLMVEPLKLALGRARPDFDPHPVMTSSLSFPSGHSANSMAAFMAIALIAVPASHRRSAILLALLLILLVGLSRIYLGVHWPSDVIGGWCLGLLMVWIAAFGGLRSGAIEAEHQVVGGHRRALGEDEAA
jgi:undecaprenyl-diphosphatase